MKNSVLSQALRFNPVGHLTALAVKTDGESLVPHYKTFNTVSSYKMENKILFIHAACTSELVSC